MTIGLNAPAGHGLPRALLDRAVRAALAGEGVARGEISVTFLPDPSILELNRRWRGHDWVPDVLSFALQDPGEPPVGDIYVGIEQAARQATEHDVPLDEELVRLTVHGVLHVLGHDHPDQGSPTSPMVRKQEDLVRAVMAGEEREP